MSATLKSLSRPWAVVGAFVGGSMHIAGGKIESGQGNVLVRLKTLYLFGLRVYFFVFQICGFSI